MSTFGKILVFVALVTSITAAVLGVLLNNQKASYATQLERMESTLKQVTGDYKASFKTSQAEPSATIIKSLQKLKEFQSTSEEKIQKIEELEASVAQLEKTKTSLESELASKHEELKETKQLLDTSLSQVEDLQDRVQEIDALLEGRDLHQILNRYELATTEADALKTEKKILEDKISELVAQVRSLQTKDQLPTENHKNISGQVIAVNRPWNFVVTDIGRQQKLSEGLELSIYRNGQVVAKIKTVSVDDTTSVADIVPNSITSDIQIGDQVAF